MLFFHLVNNWYARYAKNKNINKEKTDGITKPQIDISPANIKFARCIEAAMLNTIPAIFLIFIIAWEYCIEDFFDV